MVRHIKKFTARVFHDINYRILWLEALLFSAFIGAGSRSWVVFGLLFLGLSWLLNLRKGTAYMIYALSLLWGFIPFCMGTAWGGWGWGAALGGVAFISGVRIHYRDLKRPWDGVDFAGYNNAVEWRQNWYWGRQNLN